MKINKTIELEKIIALFSSNNWTQRLRGLSKAITLMEGNPSAGKKLIELCHPRKSGDPKHSHVIGITGLPGAGKSTLTNLLIQKLRQEGKSVCILAVDPSSQLSGGAILGDRIRMQDHFHDEQVFIRSMSSRGALGGLALATQSAIQLAKKADFDVILVETVGVGQSESEIIKIADTSILVLMPNSGDEVQLMKSGVIQLAHIYVINKSDIADTTWMEQELKENVLTSNSQHWNPPVLKTSALKQDGISELIKAINDHGIFLAQNGKSDIQKVNNVTLEKEMIVKSINHLGIVPKDPKQARHFFSDILGLTNENSETVPDQKVSIDFLDCNKVRLELLSPTSPESPIAKFLETKGSGIQHIAFEVENLEHWLEHLRQNDIELIDKIPKKGAHQTRIAFVHPRSTGGILVELVEEKTKDID